MAEQENTNKQPKQEWEDKDIGYTFEAFQEQLNRIENSQNSLKTDFKTFRDNLNGRVKNLELWRSWILGGMAVLGFIVLLLPIILEIA